MWKSLTESQWLRKRDAIESHFKFYLYIESFRRVRLRLVSSLFCSGSYSFRFLFASLWHRHHSQFISIKVLFDVCRCCCCDCFFESCHYYPLLLRKHKFQTLVKHYILSGCFFFSRRWIALGFASLVRLHTLTHLYTNKLNTITQSVALEKYARTLRPFFWFYFPFFGSFFSTLAFFILSFPLSFAVHLCSVWCTFPFSFVIISNGLRWSLTTELCDNK